MQFNEFEYHFACSPPPRDKLWIRPCFDCLASSAPFTNIQTYLLTDLVNLLVDCVRCYARAALSGAWLYVVCRAINNHYYLIGKFGIRDRGEARATATYDQLEKVHLLRPVVPLFTYCLSVCVFFLCLLRLNCLS